jgi:F-type H+-transporting ATPase subunit b
LILLSGLLIAVPTGFAREEGQGGEAKQAESEHGGGEIWKWANFLILAGFLGYLVGKNAGPFFAARSRQIRKEMVEAAEVRKEADSRVAEVERRLANLEADMAALRSQSQAEADREMERIRQRTAAEIAKVQAQSEQEIASAGKAARMELKRYSAQLAIELAGQKVRSRMNPQVQEDLARGFIEDLGHPSSKARTR